jgi:CheY-like chemotaxis protein
VESSRPRVLVIDDSNVVLKVLKRALEEKGLAVETARDGAEGVQRVADSAFDLVVIDGMMPGMDGFEVCRQIAATRREGRPILVMHSNLYKDFKDRHEAMACGADAFVLKVLDGGPLVEKVVELLSTGEAAAP